MTKNTLNLHFELLDKTRRKLLEKLLVYAKGFVLSGGTALALQLQHRKSFDFDFFSFSSLEKRFLERIGKTKEIANVSVDSAEELTFFTQDGVKVTFLQYPFKSNFPIITAEKGLRIFSVPEIALQKAYTIGRRGEYRDYFDLYAILKKKYLDFSTLISLASKTYGGAFDEKLFLGQLVYFGDLLNFDIIPIGKGPILKPEDVKNFFEKLVKKYLQ